MTRLSLAHLLLFVCGTILAVVDSNVIGIDFATDSMKVAIVQPGTPLEIVTNFQSKRKTPTCLAFYKDERLFGSDAYALMGRKPEVSISRVFRMLGRTVDHPHIKEIAQQYFPYELQRNDSSSSTVVKVENSVYTPEELVAMLLQHVKDMTMAFGGKTIKDCVITVPSFFTQHEKNALYTAAEIADLKVLSLIEENTAAALHYGTDRVFEQPHTVLFYNLGAGSTQVSIVTYSSYTAKEGGKNKTIGQLEVVGKGWDASLGGFNFDLRLTDMLAQRFNAVWQKKPSGKDKDLRDFVRPMTRLRLEANKVKEVLSANAEFPVRAEQLHADVDLVTKVTRAEFEAACSDLFARLTGPIEQALRMANMTLADLHAVELLGGGVRMPKVKKTLEDYFGQAQTHKIDVGQHLNGDEAMALGAAFRAANLSTAFRVRKVGMHDSAAVGIAVHLETLPGAEETSVVEGETAWSKSAGLYPRRSAIPGKTKTVAFHLSKDVACTLQYDNHSSLFTSEPVVAQYHISGVAQFAKDYAQNTTNSAGEVVQPKVHLSFALDASGRVELVKAEATLELPLPPSEEGDAAADASAADSSNSTDAAASADETASNTTSADGKKKALSSQLLRRALTIERVDSASALSPHRWTEEQVQQAKDRLAVLQAADAARHARAAARNDLEAYIYKVKNRLSDEEEQLRSISTEEQRQEIVDLANESEDWLYDAGREASVDACTDKHTALQKLAQALFTRFDEVQLRSDAVRKARSSLAMVREQSSAWNTSEVMPQVTAEEVEGLRSLVSAAEQWLYDKEEAQAAASPFETPVFASAEVAKQLRPVATMFDKLSKKPKPAPEKVVPAKEANETAEAAADSTASDAEKPEAEAADAAEADAAHDETKDKADDEL